MSRIVPRVVKPSRMSAGSISCRPNAHVVYSVNSPVRRISSLVPRWPQGEFSSLFRLLDDYGNHAMHRGVDRSGGFSSFSPSFDVRETEEAYHLEGETPGFTQENIEIEFTDPQTLLIKGRMERKSSSGSPAIEAAVNSADSSTETIEQPTSTTESNADSATTASPPTPAESAADAPVKADRDGYYWVTERSYGKFSRTFGFPSKVDQDAVKATLKDGILSIVVPKSATPAAKRILIE